MLRTNHYRRAIGLVELMVAMALSIGIMWILAESFKMGLDFTRHAHSTGTMMSQLDGARAVMARDFLAEHFLPDDNKPGRGVRLSDQRLDKLTNGGSEWYPPTGGFFRIISPTQTFVNFDSNNYSMNTAANHALHFTSVLAAKDQNLYTVNVGGVPYYSRAAEVAYFLADSGVRTSPGPGGQILYNLYRRQRLVALTSDEKSSLSNAIAGDPNAQVIAMPVPNPTNMVYTLADVTNPSNRLTITPSTLPGGGSTAPFFASNDARYGEDLLLSNVLSFEVLVDWDKSQVTGSIAPPRNTTVQGNWDWPFDTLAVNAGQNTLGSGVFDTWIGSPQNPTWNNGFSTGTANAQKLPLAVRVKQLQITTRIFDTKTKQARQSTARYGM